MFGLFLNKNTLLVLALLGVFVYPMIKNGELSLDQVLSLGGTDSEDVAFDPYASPYSAQGTFRPASIGLNPNQTLPGANVMSQVGYSPQPVAASKPSMADQLGGLLGSLFETQTVDSTGQTIPQPGTHEPAVEQSNRPATQQGNSNLLQPTSSGEPPLVDVREIIRFDVSPFWVQQRWPRVSAAPVSEEGYQGLRVPLTTGPGAIELTGALTYYFDKEQVVQRIQFQGTTNQPVLLKNLCQQYFQFQEIADMPGVMAPVHEGQPRGLLKLSLPVVIDRSRPATQSAVALEINSTRGKYQLSQLMRMIAVQ